MACRFNYSGFAGCIFRFTPDGRDLQQDLF